MLGSTIGQYRVTSLIGQGGMGSVYAAEHTLLGRPAAIKLLLPQLSRNQDFVTRFFNEARAATSIRHPSIVEVYDFGWTQDGAAYIVMEHLQGEVLSRRALRGRFTWSAALAVARQIAGALAAAHGKQIVHRDLKPDNVFLVPDSEVPGGERIKLLDFGIAKLAGDTQNGMNNVTRTGSVLGTPTYMAPEQCRGVAVDQRADLYSLGCIIFELCSGRPPFVGEGTGDVLAAHIHVPPPMLSSLAPTVPPHVDHLVARLLAKAPAERVQSAEELIHAIDTIVGHHPSVGGGFATGPRISTVPTTPTTLSGAARGGTHPPAPVAPRSRLPLVIGAGVIAGAVIAVLALRGGDDTAPREPSTDEPRAAAPATPPPPAVRKAEVVAVAPLAVPAAPPPADVGSGSAADTVAVSIKTTPPGAAILIDSRTLGKAPYQGALARSDRDITLVVKLSGYVDKKIVVRPDHAIDEQLKLVRIGPARPKPVDRDQSVNPFGD